MSKNVLFVDGIADNLMVKMLKVGKNETVFDVMGSCNLYATLQSSLLTKELLIFDADDNSAINLDNIDIIFNQLADFDGYTQVLKKVDVLARVAKVPLLNLATEIVKTTRDNVVQNLEDIVDLTVPLTLRVQPLTPQHIIDIVQKSPLQYPLLIRECGSHGGAQIYKVDNEDAIKTLYAIALDGRAYYMTQYVDYADTKGLFQKTRLVVVDGEVYVRHSIVSNKWMIHASSREVAYHQREKAYLERFERDIKPTITPIIKNICEKIKLDYFGIDCAIDEEGNILLFELNANMNVLVKSNNYTDSYVETINSAVEAMILKRLHAL